MRSISRGDRAVGGDGREKGRVPGVGAAGRWLSSREGWRPSSRGTSDGMRVFATMVSARSRTRSVCMIRDSITFRRRKIHDRTRPLSRRTNVPARMFRLALRIYLPTSRDSNILSYLFRRDQLGWRKGKKIISFPLSMAMILPSIGLPTRGSFSRFWNTLAFPVFETSVVAPVAVQLSPRLVFAGYGVRPATRETHPFNYPADFFRLKALRRATIQVDSFWIEGFFLIMEIFRGWFSVFFSFGRPCRDWMIALKCIYEVGWTFTCSLVFGV